MSVLCTKCKESLKSQDDIFATSCGHLYHFICLRECHNKETICSHCKAYKPWIYKMCLEFGEASEPVCWEDQTKTLNLLTELEEKYNIINNLEEKYQFSQVSVQQLEGKLKKLNDALISSRTEITNLQDRVLSYEKLNESLHNEVQLNHANCQSGTRKWDGGISMPNISGYEKNPQNLQDRFLSYEKLNESLHNEMQLYLENCQSGTRKSDGEISMPIFSRYEKIAQNSIGNKDSGNVSELEQIPRGINDSKILIRNFPLKNLEKWGLKENVIYLAKNMGIKLTQEEVNVIVMKNGIYGCLVVDFNSVAYRKKFFNKRNVLLKFNNTKNLEIQLEPSNKDL